LFREASLRQTNASSPQEETLDAALVLRELSERWRRAVTVEYRSSASMAHIGEVPCQVRSHIRLRRPNLARMVFVASRDQFSRVRVCDGRRLVERDRGNPIRPARTIQMAYTGRFTDQIPHPLEILGYSADQFFSRAPFYPPPTWGNGKLDISAVRIPYTDPKINKRRDRIRLIFQGGQEKDTLTLDAASYAPVELVRFGFHAEIAQELMRETFDRVILGGNLPPDIFRWTEADETGQTLRL
jgi:hypothetical protein